MKSFINTGSSLDVVLNLSQALSILDMPASFHVSTFILALLWALIFVVLAVRIGIKSTYVMMKKCGLRMEAMGLPQLPKLLDVLAPMRVARDCLLTVANCSFKLPQYRFELYLWRTMVFLSASFVFLPTLGAFAPISMILVTTSHHQL